ncbi:alpha-tocopherol transfer protein-like isoform X2 [Stegodyphus dumicola]|uniref:alpha-tocopherol transfer protein-like isoform X2 n=1 Tax=Stegodyphus dumicola TaxID=202533 RepID=UPI0015AC0D9D|nr:alpha-tocopherol transfer protein-like isoform X2 [Stegodyphus dumicola]
MERDDEDLAAIELEDMYLLVFLRFNKFNLSRTYSHLKIFDNFRKQNPDSFKKINFEECVKGITSEIISFLPWRCPDGCAILLVQLDKWNPDELSVEALKRLLLVYIGQSLRSPMTQINGIKIIADVKSNPIKHLKYCTPENLYLLYYGGKECAPARYISIHIINSSVTSKIGWFIIKQFLSEKLKKRIHFHSSPEKLLKYFPRSALPMKYGGDIISYDMTKWLKDVMEPEKIANLRGESVPIRK